MAEDLAAYRKALANTIAWNKPENIKRRQTLEKIIQAEIDRRAERRKALYEALNGDLNGHEHADARNGVDNAEVLS